MVLRVRSAAAGIAASMVFTLGVALAAPSEGQSWRPRSVHVDTRVSEIVATVSDAELVKSIEALVAFGNRNTFHEPASADKGIGGARAWIRKRFEEISAANGGRLQVSEDVFQTSLPKDVAERLKLEAVEAANIVAILPGADPVSRERLVIVGAHYDSRNEERYDVANPAPGANDNASGVAAVIELARVLAPHGFGATLVFIAFSGKEQGLWGSANFARNARKDGMNVEAVLINDAIGNVYGGGGRVDGTGVRVFAPSPDESPSRDLARFVRERGMAYVPRFDVRLVYRADRMNRTGDQRPFQEAGYAAVGIVEAAENFERQDAKSDVAKFVDAGMLGRVTRVNASVLASLAAGPPKPVKVKRNWEASHYDTRVVWDIGEGTAASYRLVVRETTSALWQWEVDAGSGGDFTLKGVSMDDYVVAILAVDAEGDESLPVVVR